MVKNASWLNGKGRIMWAEQLSKSLMAHRHHKLMLDSVCKCFPSILRDEVTLQTNRLNICDGHYVDITAEIWDDVIDLLHVVEVTRYIDIFPSGEIRTSKISRKMRVDKLLADASQILGHCPTPVKAVQFVGGSSGGAVVMRENRSIGSYNIKDGGSISILFSGPGPGGVVLPEYRKNRFKNEDNLQSPPSSPRAKKPVIYLYSPSDIDVSVKLSLIPEWTLSAFYPVVVTEDHRQRLEWNVLGLHTEARTSFISYWLSSILKHRYIALRFVPQSVYERAASLTISPQPDVVTRVFMLFRGASEEHLANWSNAQMQAEKDVAWWVDVVGVDIARAGDVALFRVLEWGGMEFGYITIKRCQGNGENSSSKNVGVQKSKAMHLYEFESIIEMRSGTLSVK
ncbi:hypothetical protein BDR07DRAFT_1379016 [Suillus spraguei]|nr:hypothetical protein BDR07DRAFT_1379016 [Suillus spraguei]